jgi:hypothetical protein
VLQAAEIEQDGLPYSHDHRHGNACSECGRDFVEPGHKHTEERIRLDRVATEL